VPPPVENLLAVAAFRAHAKQFGITDVTLQGNTIRFAPVKLRESQMLRLQRLFPGTIVKQTVDTVLVPRPKTARIGGTPLRDTDLLTWAMGLLDAVLGDSVRAGAAAGASSAT